MKINQKILKNIQFVLGNSLVAWANSLAVLRSPQQEGYAGQAVICRLFYFTRLGEDQAVPRLASLYNC